MKAFFVMETIEQLRAFSHPIRYQMLNHLALKSLTGAQLARTMKMPRQRLHYHLKILRQAGLITQVEGPEDQGVVEKYYRSVAENYTSPYLQNLVPQKEMDLPVKKLRSQSLREISLTLIEQAKVDLSQPDVLDNLSGLSSPFQHTVFLTLEQEREIHARFQVIKQDLLQLSEENLGRQPGEKLLNVRYTLLITPSCTGEQGD